MAVELIGKIKPKNNGSFPMVDAQDVEMPDGSRLPEFLEGFAPGGSGGGAATWDDLQGKPFGERAVHMEVSAETISNVSFEGLGMTWMKVSAQTLTKEELLGGRLRVIDEDYEQSAVITQDDIIIANEQGTAVLQQELMVPFIMVYKPGEMTITVMGETATVNIPESGCYATGFELSAEGRIIIDNQLVKQLDSKFLPMEAIKTYIDDYINEALGGDY